MPTTDLSKFRNQYISTAKDRLLGIDLPTADNNTLLVAGALFKMFDTVNKIDPITPDSISLLELMTGAELETYLADASNRQSFETVIASAEAMKAIAGSSDACVALAGSDRAIAAWSIRADAQNALLLSPIAMDKIAASAAARTALLATTSAMSVISGSSMAIAKLAIGIVGMDPQSYADMAAVAASSTAMNAVAASSTAMNAVAASSTAMNAIFASLVAIKIVAANKVGRDKILTTSALLTQAQAQINATMLLAAGAAGKTPSAYADGAAVIASSDAMTAVAGSATAMSAVAGSATAMSAVAGSATAMSTLFNSATARAVIWASSTAITAIQNAPSSVLDALQSHANVIMMNNNPSNLQSTFINGKSMTLRVRNTSGSDTNYMRTMAGGSGVGDDIFTTTNTWTTRVRAYNNLTHYSWSNNYTFQAYVVNMN